MSEAVCMLSPWINILCVIMSPTIIKSRGECEIMAVLLIGIWEPQLWYWQL